MFTRMFSLLNTSSNRRSMARPHIQSVRTGQPTQYILCTSECFSTHTQSISRHDGSIGHGQAYLLANENARRSKHPKYSAGTKWNNTDFLTARCTFVHPTEK
jgi:hypothetical protein